MAVDDRQLALSTRNIGKRFPGVVALQGVDFDLRKGEVHALLGENGAGKSTLVKILTGAYIPDEGEIFVDGERRHFTSPVDAQRAGIAVVYQEFSQVASLSVAENIFMGALPRRGPAVDWSQMRAATARLLESFGLDIDPFAPLSSLSVAKRQIIEIIKALNRTAANILIMDEPTSALTDTDVATLLALVTRLKARGIGVIYVSHRLNEIEQIADRATIFRNGRKVATRDITELTVPTIVSLMIGRDLKNHFPPKIDNAPGPEALRVEGLANSRCRGVSFAASQSEVLGVVGLLGAGKTETLEGLFGANGSKLALSVKGRTVAVRSPRDAMRAGIGLIPESRKEQGLVLCLSVATNTTLTILKSLGRPFLNLARESRIARQFVELLKIKPGNPRAIAVNLSGGNQQKIVIAKWLARKADIMLFDEPTRGIDVGAKYEIYSGITDLARAGKCVIIASSEAEEIAGVCTRVIVLDRGRVVHELTRDEIDVDNILAAMSHRSQDALPETGAEVTT